MKKVLFILIPIILICGIIAGGIYYYQAQKTKKQTVNTVATKEENKNEVANWQTYTDTEYGYSFQYPANTAVNKSQDGKITISDIASGYGLYSVSAEKATKSLENYANDEINNFVGMQRPSGVPIAKSEVNVADITVGSQPAKKITVNNFGDRGNEIVDVIYTNSNGDNILLKLWGDTSYTDFNTTFLNSFEFLSKTNSKDETANWQTYTNQRYGYSIKYPANWFAHTDSAEKDYTKRGGEDVGIDYIGGDVGWTNYERENFTPADEPSDLVGVSMMIWKSDKTNEQFLNDEKTSLANNKEASNVVVSDIQGRPFIKFILTWAKQAGNEPAGTKRLGAVVKIDGGIMQFDYTPLTPSRIKTDNGKIFDLMISSLKFTK